MAFINNQSLISPSDLRPIQLRCSQWFSVPTKTRIKLMSSVSGEQRPNSWQLPTMPLLHRLSKLQPPLLLLLLLLLLLFLLQVVMMLPSRILVMKRRHTSLICGALKARSFPRLTRYRSVRLTVSARSSGCT